MSTKTIKEINCFVLLLGEHFRTRTLELYELIEHKTGTRDLEPGTYYVNIVRIGDEQTAEDSRLKVLSLKHAP